jgi:regulator of cell morphogenesis and NO signaling
MKEEGIFTRTIGEIVASDYRTASIFKEEGIDFCCGGNKSFEETCSEKGIDPAKLIRKFETIDSTPNTTTHLYNEWTPEFLCDYIINTHHRYVLKSLPDLVQYTAKISSVHGERHTELAVVAELFSQINRELLQHMKKEEELFFPAIKEVFRSGSETAKATIVSEMSRLSVEHEFAGNTMDMINVITHKYLVPPDGCNTYHLTFKLLQEFEDDLHTHIHLENNILFPKALNISR